MFYILRGAETEAGWPTVVCVEFDADRLETCLVDLKMADPTGRFIVTEWLYGSTEPRGAARVPAELDRAIAAWNAMCDRLPVKLPKVRAAAQFVSPYRRWKRENSGRSYLLEKLVEDVARQSWCHSWISFGWLFGKKNGEPNSEKLRNGKFDAPRRNDSRPITPDDEFTPTER